MNPSRCTTAAARRAAATFVLIAAAACLPSFAADAAPGEPPKGGTGQGEPARPAPPKAEMETRFLVLLRKGPNWSATPTPESKAIQEGHLANIGRLWKEGKLAVAGPLGDNGDIRGIFIFQVGTIEEVKALTDTDPAIKAGRLVAEIHPWWVDRRALPQAGKYCQSVEPE